MPPLTCPRCQRTNPAAALYCYFDGNLLRLDVAPAHPGQFQQEFVFPSKRRCRTLDDFVQGCQYEWDDARDLLKRGDFSRFFQQISRHDLVKAAREAETQADADVGLYRFLDKLPASKTQGPKLDLLPRRYQLSRVFPGEIKQVSLKILNRGKGLLQGRASVSSDCNWLQFVEGDEDGLHCPIKAAKEQVVTLQIDARELTPPQSYSAKLTLVTNGGIAEVPVRVDLGATPFALAPFRGVITAREMAEKIKANPRAAVPLLENGELQRWFESNGWTYPIQGQPAPGVAAVQQFFEGMGLTRPPVLQLSENDVLCFCIPPEVIQRQVTLYTDTRKWVYAVIESETFWIKVLTPTIAGAQQAAFAFEVDSSLLDPGQSHEGSLQIVGNGEQRLSVRVVVDVHQPHIPFTRRLFGGMFGKGGG